MAYLEDYNQIVTDGGYKITTNARIRQYLSYNDLLIVRTGAKSGDLEFKKSASDSNVFCYDDYGRLLWKWNDNEIADIRITKGKLVLYNPSGLGYAFVVDEKTGNKLKIDTIH